MLDRIRLQNLISGLQHKDVRLYDALSGIVENLFSLSSDVDSLNTSGEKLDIVRYVPATFTKTTDITVEQIPGLWAVLESDKRYIFDANLLCDPSAAGGLRITVSGLIDPYIVRYEIFGVNNDSDSISNSTHITALDVETTTVGGAEYFIFIRGYIHTRSAGTLVIKFAQNISNGSSIVEEGSYLKVREI